MKHKPDIRKILILLIVCLVIPAAAIGGMFLSGQKVYYAVSAAVAVLACVPFFLRFEKGRNGTVQITVTAVMTAISVVSRLLFAEIPAFKPVTALVVITALYFGAESGFMTGALSALLSNIYFGQGPWTPFQMFAWGLCGFLAGLLAKQLTKKLWLTVLYGGLAGILYSLILDINTVLWLGGEFSVSRYIAAITASLPTTGIYVVSNVVFLLIAAKPLGKVFTRLKTKYGIN